MNVKVFIGIDVTIKKEKNKYTLEDMAKATLGDVIDKFRIGRVLTLPFNVLRKGVILRHGGVLLVVEREGFMYDIDEDIYYPKFKPLIIWETNKEDTKINLDRYYDLGFERYD
jgi:hypothetical protein